MTEEEKKAALDKPFGQDEAPAGEAPAEPIKPIEPAEAEPVVEPEPARVPYSRFKNVSEARREAEAEAEKWRERAIALENQRFQRPQTQSPSEVPSWWTKLYGDNDQTREAYSLWYEGQVGIIQAAEEKALRAVQEAQQAEQVAVRENLSALDEHLEMVSAVAGRELTDKEQSDILDIVDEYTAKDDDGNYLGAILPADKAWEIYEMKHDVAKAPSKQARDNAASVIATPSSGQPTPEQQERDKNWRPWSTERYPQ